MVKNAKEIAAGQFKAKCLSLLDEVARTGGALVVTKRGKPVARVVPIDEADARTLRGTVIYHGDVVAPIDADWESAK